MLRTNRILHRSSSLHILDKKWTIYLCNWAVRDDMETVNKTMHYHLHIRSRRHIRRRSPLRIQLRILQRIQVVQSSHLPILIQNTNIPSINIS